MSEESNQQREITVLMDDIAFGANFEGPYMDHLSSETRNSSAERAAEQMEDECEVLDPECVIKNCASESNESCSAFLLRILATLVCKKSVIVPPVAGNLLDEIDVFISGVWRYEKNIYGRELAADTEELFRQILSAWNRFLQSQQGIPGTSAIMSLNINEDINLFIPWLRGTQCNEDTKKLIKEWLSDWNMFLQARAGNPLVTCLNLCLSIMGFILYIMDQASDIGMFMYYINNGQWWRALVTLSFVYGAVIIHTGIKWISGHIHCTGSVSWLWYVASLLVNWPDVKQYGVLCVLEWKLYKSPANSAHLVPEWHRRRYNVARLKFTEGLYEACPQAILQFCLLVPNMYGDLTSTEYLRIAAASVSLCTAGAALVNDEKYERIYNNSDLPLSELVVLHVWAVPVTVSRLLSLTLILTVHPYWTLVGIALNLVLYGANWCRVLGVPRTLKYVMAMCVLTVQFFISPFIIPWSITYRRLNHAIHFLVNTAAMVLWALGTPLVCAHPALYTAIICFNAIIFAVGLLGWQLHEKYWTPIL